MTDDDALKVHVGDTGHVWFALGNHAPEGTELSPRQFVASHRGAHLAVRVLGTQNNAQLVKELLAVPSFQVEIGGPYICEAPPDMCDPYYVLHAMRQCRLASSMGGWHAATPHDQTTYCLIAYMQAHAWDALAEAMLHNHPAWRGLSFIPKLNVERVATLLNTIVDPRWHVCPSAPNRTSRLCAALGLQPVLQARVERDAAYSTLAQRCSLVYHCWAYGPPELESPNAFLWRVSHAGGDGVRGHLRASRKFIIFLRYVWLDSLYRHTRYSGRQGLFAPDMLFKTPEEVAAFKTHYAAAISSLDKPGDRL